MSRDYLDLLAGDVKTRAIVMYLETIPNPRKFMSAARAAARVKPVIAIKSGRHEQAAKAAATHTGALSGADRVVEAALGRAGVLARATASRSCSMPPRPWRGLRRCGRSRVGIVTNGGGAGVLAVDQLVDCRRRTGGAFAGHDRSLERARCRRPGRTPTRWTSSAMRRPERYKAAVEAVAGDPGTDALLVLNCPTGLASPTDAANAVAEITSKGMINGKPVLTCWLGEHSARERPPHPAAGRRGKLRDSGRCGNRGFLSGRLVSRAEGADAGAAEPKRRCRG